MTRQSLFFLRSAEKNLDFGVKKEKEYWTQEVMSQGNPKKKENCLQQKLIVRKKEKEKENCIQKVNRFSFCQSRNRSTNTNANTNTNTNTNQNIK